MPREFITDSNYSLLVLTVSWFTCAIAILGTVARAIAKIVFRRAFSLDDYSSSLSILLVIAQTVAVTIRTSNGLGKHVDTLVTSQVSAYLKATYADNILYISSMCFSEVSVLLLLNLITPSRRDRRVLFAVGGFIGTWSLVALLVSTVNCGSPKPWDWFDGHCIDQISWSTSIEVLNLMINVALIGAPILILYDLQMPVLRKLSVMSIFGLRIAVCVASICKLVYLSRLRNTKDLVFAVWLVTLCTQTVQCLSIITFSSLYLKPLFEAFESGFIRSDDMRRKGLKAPDGTYNLSFLNGDEANNSATSFKGSRNAGNKSTVTADRWRGNLDSHSTKTQLPIIQKTKSFAVEW